MYFFVAMDMRDEGEDQVLSFRRCCGGAGSYSETLWGQFNQGAFYGLDRITGVSNEAGN